MFQKSDKLDDYITLKQLRAKTTYLVKSSKTNSWKTFTFSISTQTDPKQVQSKIRSLRGQNNKKQIDIIKDDKLITDPLEAANTLGELFYKNRTDSN